MPTSAGSASSLPEDAGGVGLGLPEEVMLFREFGRHLAPGPFLVVAFSARGWPRSPEPPSWPRRSRPGSAGSASRSVTVRAVDARPGDLLLRSTSDASAELFDVESVEQSPASTPARGSPESPDGASVAARRRPSCSCNRARVLAAAEQLGIIEAVRDMSAAYAQTRIQFDKPIGTFQAVKHRCADMAIAAYATVGQVFQAALLVDGATPRTPPSTPPPAYVLATTGPRRSTADNIQNHGGIGFTWEQDSHLFLKRTTTLTNLFGPLRDATDRCSHRPATSSADRGHPPADAAGTEEITVTSTPPARTRGDVTESLFIDGRWRAAADGRRFAVENPATGEELAEVADAGATDVATAVAAAAAALPPWAARTAYERSAVLYEAHRLMTEQAEQLAQLMTAEQGKPLRAARTEVKYASDFLLWFAEEAKRVYGEMIPSARGDQRFLVLHEPVGVVGAITPWNYPISMITRKVAPALAAGCTIVLKPAEQTPLCAIETFRILERRRPAGRCRQPGHHGRPAADRRRAAHRLAPSPSSPSPGPPRSARCWPGAAAEQLKRISLELGGHAPVHRLPGCRPGARGEGCGNGEDAQHRPGLHLAQPHLRPSQHR